LREEEVSSAVKKLCGDSSKVWNWNVRLLQNLDKAFGRDNVEQIMKGEKMDGIETFLKETKEEWKMKMGQRQVVNIILFSMEINENLNVVNVFIFLSLLSIYIRLCGVIFPFRQKYISCPI
jgi:hypothetical protein